MNDWTKTQIWQRLIKLKNDEAVSIRIFLSEKDTLPKIQTILNLGSTSPKDFTLHDADHSFRVAERMWEIIPGNTQKILSEYELALMLLSAYLHDIGMTPSFKMVNNHFVCLTTNNKTALSQAEIKEFQKWLDEEGEQINLQVDIVEEYEKAADLIMLYCRYKHNDWSELWMRENFKGKDLGKYTNWLNDLINICKSHHFGLEELKTEKFNPFRLHGKVVHRRYLAMCLRLADVIEIDPERAPEVLIKHRDIITGSISHWLKEKFTSIDIVNSSISITAYPTHAFVHKAINDIANQVERETNLCNTLKGEIPLQNISPSNDLKHIWNITPSVHREIKEAGNYEFIDGTFKPNSKKLLQLFAGTELYGNPMLAIRELLQNAIDAIKVQIGYKVLDQNLMSPIQIEAVKNKFNINLSLFHDSGGHWISCMDNGVGMDKEIIKKCFLVGGATKRHELLDLERKCNAVGYNLEITSQFGIGVMSYFMIADRVIIKTKKSMLASNHENFGWEFEINGLSDFGELRKIDLNDSGTEIRLRLKKEIVEIFRDTNATISFLQSILTRLPCNFTFNLNGEPALQYGPGWCKDEKYFRTQLIGMFNHSASPVVETSNDFISEEDQHEIETFIVRKGRIEKEFQNLLYFIKCEGNLEGKNGFYRVHIPIFKNKGGDSFALFFEDGVDLSLFKINGGFCFYPRDNQIYWSWKGIKINPSAHHRINLRKLPRCFIELDLANDKTSKISVSRLEIDYAGSLNSIEHTIEREISDLIVLQQDNLANSIYGLFNCTIALPLIANDQYQYWTYESGYNRDALNLEKLTFPILFDISAFGTRDYSIYYNNGKISHLSYIYGTGAEYSRELFGIDKYKYRFDRAVYRPYNNFRISFLRVTPFSGDNKYSFIGNSTVFPPAWDKLLCFRGYDMNDVVLNENNVITSLITSTDYDYIKSFFRNKTGLNSAEGSRILNSNSLCASLLLHLINLNDQGNWMGVIKNNKKFVSDLWHVLFGNQEEIVYFFHDGISTTNLTAISQEGWILRRKFNEICEFLPLPDNEWKLEVPR